MLAPTLTLVVLPDKLVLLVIGIPGGITAACDRGDIAVTVIGECVCAVETGSVQHQRGDLIEGIAGPDFSGPACLGCGLCGKDIFC